MTGEPRLGVVLRPQIEPERLREAVRRCDAAGVDDVWLWEDCFLTGGIAASTAALAWSDKVRVGLGLMPVPFRNPALAAMEIAAVARLFPGRFAPAVGHGVLDWMSQTGVRAASPLTLLREHAGAVRALLHGERVTVDGRYVHLDDVALDWPPAADDTPPLLFGARGDKTLALAGELADGVVLDDGDDDHQDLDGERLARAVGVALEARAAGALSDKPFEVVAYVGLGADPAERARELVAAGATTLAFQPTGDAPDPAEALAAVAAAREATAPPD